MKPMKPAVMGIVALVAMHHLCVAKVGLITRRTSLQYNFNVMESAEREMPAWIRRACSTAKYLLVDLPYPFPHILMFL